MVEAFHHGILKLSGKEQKATRPPILLTVSLEESPTWSGIQTTLDEEQRSAGASGFIGSTSNRPHVTLSVASMMSILRWISTLMCEADQRSPLESSRPLPIAQAPSDKTRARSASAPAALPTGCDDLSFSDSDDTTGESLDAACSEASADSHENDRTSDI